MKTLAFCICLFALAGSNSAAAAPCAGFGDLDDSSPFCTDVIWLKSRNITLGCAGPAGNESLPRYCPHDPVNRLAMAAFLHRLGQAVAPTNLMAEEAFVGGRQLGQGWYVCVTPGLAPQGFDRWAEISASLHFSLSSADPILVRPVFSWDGGANWGWLNEAQTLFTHSSGQGNGSVMSTSFPVPQGVILRAALHVTRSASSTADITGGACVLRTIVHPVG